MHAIAAKLALVAVVGWAIWMTLQPRLLFVIELRDGAPRAKSGRVTAAMLQGVGSLCREHGVLQGRIRCVRRSGGREALQFSREFPPSLQQQLRNAYESMRWPTSLSRTLPMCGETQTAHY